MQETESQETAAEPEAEETAVPEPEEIEGNVVIDDVTFGYKKESIILKNFSLSFLIGRENDVFFLLDHSKLTCFSLYCYFKKNCCYNN